MKLTTFDKFIVATMVAGFAAVAILAVLAIRDAYRYFFP